MPILHYMYYAKYGSGLLRVSMSYAKQGVNRKQTLRPRFPRRPTDHFIPQVPYHQTVATDSGDSMGCMPYRSRDRARAVHGRWHTIPVAIRWPILPIPPHVGDRQAPETYRFRCNQGQKGSVMHRFRGYRGKLDAKKYQVPPRFPRLRGCTWPIVNSWVKFFRGVRGREYPSGHVKQNRHAAIPRAGYTSGLFQPHLVCTPFPLCQVKSTRGHSTGGRIDPEGGYTLRAGSYSGPAVVARSRVGPSIKFRGFGNGAYTHVGAYIRVHNKITYWQRIVLTFSMGLVLYGQTGGQRAEGRQ